jgi:hypothetical protein
LRKAAKILLSLVLASGGLFVTAPPAQAGCSGDICLGEACAAVENVLREHGGLEVNGLNCIQ